MTNRPDRLCALADSPRAGIRWRFSDYEQLLKKQLKLLASPLESDSISDDPTIISVLPRARRHHDSHHP